MALIEAQRRQVWREGDRAAGRCGGRQLLVQRHFVAAGIHRCDRGSACQAGSRRGHADADAGGRGEAEGDGAGRRVRAGRERDVRARIQAQDGPHCAQQCIERWRCAVGRQLKRQRIGRSRRRRQLQVETWAEARPGIELYHGIGRARSPAVEVGDTPRGEVDVVVVERDGHRDGGHPRAPLGSQPQIFEGQRVGDLDDRRRDGLRREVRRFVSRAESGEWLKVCLLGDPGARRVLRRRQGERRRRDRGCGARGGGGRDEGG